MISEKPGMAQPYVGRGTAYAMKRLLLEAQEDFTEAIKRDSNTTEAWKRRGQVRAAMGDHTAAVDDFKEAKKLSSVIQH
jgi:Tfp pilus assembly protein PilF